MKTLSDERQSAEENDPQVMHLVCALLNLDRQQVRERVSLLLQLGERYLALALLQEDGQCEDQAARALLYRRCATSLSFLPALFQRDERALAWCREAASVFATVLAQVQTTQSASAAYSGRGAAYAVLGMVELALEDFTQALRQASAVQQQAELYYWRGITFAQQGQCAAALVDVSYALDLDPACPAYRLAQDRLAQL